MKLPSLQAVVVTLLATVLFGVALQGPIAVLAELHTGSWALVVKSWKEILLGITAIALVVALWRSGRSREFFERKIVWLVAAIALLHVFLLIVFTNHYVGEVAALLIDLRMYLMFIEVYLTVFLWPKSQRVLVSAAGAGLVLIVVFAALQATLLPRDILSHLGYSKATIQPYLTVDLNDDYVRINSTLRGPNPLGAIAVIVLSLGAALMLRRVRVERWQRLAIGGVMLCALLGLWFSYSRSALLAALVAAGVLAVAVGVHRISRNVAIGCIVAVVVLATSVLLLRDTAFVQNVVFHTNPDSPTVHKSDDGHLDSLQHGTEAMLAQPFGAGLGSTGSASLLTNEPVIIENQYFYMAHESGWLGLVLQLWLFGWVMMLLWRDRLRVLSLGLLAAGAGMAVIGMVLPVWADDTVAILWWGLTGVAIALYYEQRRKQSVRHA